MEHPVSIDAALAVALALASGMVAQSLARHLRLPGIVLLLATGVLLGPDLIGVIRPETLGGALHLLVGFAVAVILFEGGMNLRLSRLRGQARPIRRLITWGALVTAVGGALAARWIMGWDWRVALPFGTLVVVTGPTVVTPLLRRIKLKHKVAAVLEAEGVLIDAIGAALAVVALQVVIRPIGSAWAAGAMGLLTRLGFGVLAGAAGGLAIGLLLRQRKVVPEGLENVFTLSLVLALYQASNFLVDESGIMAVTVAGMLVGNMRTRVQQELLEFKEQLTVMFIGLLFVLLAADVRIEGVRELGLPGALTVACLMLVIRPLNVAVGTLGSDLSARERLFVAWLAPRGVVAAAVASLSAQSLTLHGIPGGEELRALVFTVIASTVLIQGLSGGWVAGLLGLRRPPNRGYAILGANALGRALGRLLRDAGEDVVLVDSDPHVCTIAEGEGFKVVFGNVIEERTLRRAQLEERAACIAVTTNEEMNLMLARTVAEDFEIRRVYVPSSRDSGLVTPALIAAVEARLLFGLPRDHELWMVRLRRGIAPVECWKVAGAEDDAEPPDRLAFPEGLILPLVVRRGKQVFPVDAEWRPREGDIICCALFGERLDAAREWLRDRGWVQATPAPAPVSPQGPGQQEGRPAGRPP